MDDAPGTRKTRRKAEFLSDETAGTAPQHERNADRRQAGGRQVSPSVRRVQVSTSIQERVRCEVEDLHDFFTGWFTGKLPEGDFESKFLARFSPEFVLIPPAGRVLGLEALSSSLRAGYASNPDFRVQIRSVAVRRQFDGCVLATYEEWQRNAFASNPPDNGRIATVLFSSSDPLTWLHIHETWLPRDIIAAGPYDF